MSDEPFFPPLPRLMNPRKARDIGRMHQALAQLYEDAGDQRHAARSMQEATWWIAYAVALANTNERDE